MKKKRTVQFCMCFQTATNLWTPKSPSNESLPPSLPGLAVTSTLAGEKQTLSIK